jgi:16S rRNA G1207 methylase RsmC
VNATDHSDPSDPYFHRAVALRAGGRRLDLATSQELFSSHQVDRGSRLLLRVVAETIGDGIVGARGLDVGCGYGPLGLGLRAMGADAVVLVDRDALAVRYAAGNAERNGFDLVTARGSLVYDQVHERVGLVVANIPGHVSPEVIGEFVQGAARVLTDDGRAAFVIVSPLAGMATRALDAVGATVERVTEDRGHHVVVVTYGAVAPPPPAGLDLYRRGSLSVEEAGERWDVATGVGVPEFERLSHHTVAVLRHLATTDTVGGAVAVWNPGQGHVPIYLSRRGVASLVLADRDLLALRYSEANLVHNGVRPSATATVHDLDLSSCDSPLDLIVDLLRRREPALAAAARITQARSLLAPGGAVVVAGPPTAVRRVGAALTTGGIATRRIDGRRAALLRIAG